MKDRESTGSWRRSARGRGNEVGWLRRRIETTCAEIRDIVPCDAQRPAAHSGDDLRGQKEGKEAHGRGVSGRRGV